jgi:uncharacterized protein YcbK (DUF882 family)
MDPDFLYKLDNLRKDFGKPIIISSGYRCPHHNEAVSSTGLGGPHTTGKACDILVSGHDAYDLLKLVVNHGFKGIGINQKGPSRFIHLDMIDSDLRPWLWSY